MRLQALAGRRAAVTSHAARSGPGMGPILAAILGEERPRLLTRAMLGACGGWIMGAWVWGSYGCEGDTCGGVVHAAEHGEHLPKNM